ncbi:CheR family methyltransferase [Nannocystaceae bacterium ST9]
MGRNYVVGVGASAGGLEALQALVAGLPRAPGMVFLVGMHLDPSRPSALVELLGHAGPLRVEAASDGQAPQLDTMYVAPPRMQLLLIDGRMKLVSNGKTSAHPIDAMFRSIADDAGDRAIAIVLSGSGNDGSSGLAAVRAAGGITFAQDRSASFSSMPQSAVERSVVDHVLPPAEMARELLALGRHEHASPAQRRDDEAALSEILGVVRAGRNLDFAGYKTPTLHRRVHRRRVARQVGSTREYLQLLRAEPAEIDALVDDILINVTEFFRDPEAFAALASVLLPRFDARPTDRPLRIWVVGCSTGQEAYSIAMVVLEHQGETGRHHPVKILATDIDESALSFARLGFYPEDQCTAISPTRRQRFFVPASGGLQVNKDLRECCVFARHDVTRDPPFSRIDFVSCRNVLIYFESELQRRVLPSFHYALGPEGVLMLGKAESLGPLAARFEALDADQRMYLRRSGGPKEALELPSTIGSPEHLALPSPSPSPSLASGETREHQADQFLLSHYAPPALVVDAQMRVTEFRGDTSAFLINRPGLATLHVLELARADLLTHLSAALAAAKRDGEGWREQVHVRERERTLVVNLRVIRLEGPTAGFLILFESPAQSEARSATPSLVGLGRSYARRLLLSLERRAGDPEAQAQSAELELTRQRLHQLIGEHQAKTQQLEAANEELMSSNEELQSTNEELQTTKEEIQATNEELLTVNEELEARNVMLQKAEQRLRTARDYAESIVETVHEPLLVIGEDLRILSVNRAFATLLGPEPVEVRGRSLAELGIAGPEGKPPAWLERAIASDIGEDAIELELWPKSPRERVLIASVRPSSRDEREHLFLIAMSDVTAARQRERQEIQLINGVLEAQAREREHLAHELHDETGQALSAVLVGLSTLDKDVQGERATAMLAELRERVRELIASIGRMARGLHPASLEQLGFCRALRRLVDHFVDVHAIPVDLRIEREPEFDALANDTSLGLFRIVQEALTNTARHADASELHIALTLEGRHVRLKIADDGAGFDAQTSSQGLGLKLMSRRVAQLGGTLHVESAPNSGVHLQIEIPIAAAKASP